MPFRVTGEWASLPWPPGVDLIVFSDFDETYLAHSRARDEANCRAELDAYLLQECVARRMLFGWVTGSSVPSVMGKLASYGCRTLPHFIAGQLGSDLRIVSGGQMSRDEEWNDRIVGAGFSAQRVDELVRSLGPDGVLLHRQTHGTAFDLKFSYYYRTRGERADRRTLDRIQNAAQRYGLGCSVNKCNPGAGDPADCYDVDFIPQVSGKTNVVRYLCDKFAVSPEDALAFGDSAADVGMLKAVGHGWLVGNCTAEAREMHGRVTSSTYAAAILRTLCEHIDEAYEACGRSSLPLRGRS